MAKRGNTRRQKASYPFKYKGNVRTKPNNSPVGGSSTAVNLLISDTPPPITFDSDHQVSLSASKLKSKKGSRSQTSENKGCTDNNSHYILLDTDILKAITDNIYSCPLCVGKINVHNSFGKKRGLSFNMQALKKAKLLKKCV